MDAPVPETSVEVPLLFIGGRWRVDPRAFGEPLHNTAEPYLDDVLAPDDDPALVAARETPRPDGAELAELLREGLGCLS